MIRTVAELSDGYMAPRGEPNEPDEPGAAGAEAGEQRCAALAVWERLAAPGDRPARVFLRRGDEAAGELAAVDGAVSRVVLRAEPASLVVRVADVARLDVQVDAATAAALARVARRRRRRHRPSLNMSAVPGPGEPPREPELAKFWSQRRRLFSRFDEGVRLDAESWFSVTPEAVAVHVAERLRGCGLVVDAFGGAGGNTVQLARTCCQVVHCEIDPVKVACARANARVYGVEGLVEFVQGDAVALLQRARADAVFLSPPWGGLAYEASAAYRMADVDVGGVDGAGLLALAMAAAPRVAMFMPRNFSLGSLGSVGAPVEAEEVRINGKAKGVMLWVGFA